MCASRHEEDRNGTFDNAVDKRMRLHDRKSAADYIHDVYNLRATKRAIARWPIPGKLIHGRFMMSERDIDAYVEKLLDEAPAAGQSTRERFARARRCAGGRKFEYQHRNVDRRALGSGGAAAIR